MVSLIDDFRVVDADALDFSDPDVSFELVSDRFGVHDRLGLLRDLAARAEGFSNFREAVHARRDEDLDVSSVLRVGMFPVASPLAVALCDYYHCRFDDLTDYVRGAVLTERNVVLPVGVGYDVFDRDVLSGNGAGVARLEFERKYDTPAGRLLVEGKLLLLNMQRQVHDARVDVPLDQSLIAECHQRNACGEYTTYEVTLPEHCVFSTGLNAQATAVVPPRDFGGYTFTVVSDEAQPAMWDDRWLRLHLHEPVMLFARGSREPVMVRDVYALARAMNRESRVIDDTLRAEPMFDNQDLLLQARRYVVQHPESRFDQYQLSAPALSEDQISWQDRAGIEPERDRGVTDVGEPTQADPDRDAERGERGMMGHDVKQEHTQRHRRSRSR